MGSALMEYTATGLPQHIGNYTSVRHKQYVTSSLTSQHWLNYHKYFISVYLVILRPTILCGSDFGPTLIHIRTITMFHAPRAFHVRKNNFHLYRSKLHNKCFLVRCLPKKDQACLRSNNFFLFFKERICLYLYLKRR